MTTEHLIIRKSGPLHGTAELYGAKNAVLVIMTSLILTEGICILDNVPNNADVQLMITLLRELGAMVMFDTVTKRLTVDTTHICRFEVKPEIMNKIRASILVMGPLLARFGMAKVAMPGGDLIGMRPINYHLEGFKKLGADIDANPPSVTASLHRKPPLYARIILEYPSVGATENLLMFACLGESETHIINAAIEPEVLDLIDVLRKMGAQIEVLPGATLAIKAVQSLKPITHTIIPDRLEAGTLLISAAITGGSIHLPQARVDHLDIVVEKLREMGHTLITGYDLPDRSPFGITLQATDAPRSVNIKTGPFPAFPTDLQPLFMAAMSVAHGMGTIEETVYENRMIHAKELAKLGAQITLDSNKAIIRGVDTLYGTEVIASDIRASCALVLAGMVAMGQTKMTGVHHWQRGYDGLEHKLNALGARIILGDDNVTAAEEAQMKVQQFL